MNLVFAFGRMLLAAVLLYAVSPANAQSVSVLEFAGITGMSPSKSLAVPLP
jgi:hypothetical protein